jgi:hypothetical protein
MMLDFFTLIIILPTLFCHPVRGIHRRRPNMIAKVRKNS